MKTIFKILLVAVILFAVIAAFDSFYVVNEDEFAFVFRFSKVEIVSVDAGLHFKVPFIDTVKTFRKNTQLYDLTPSDVLTSDSKAMSVDSYVLWKISDPLTFYRKLGNMSEAQTRLDAATYNALKTIIGTMLQEEIITQSVEDGRNSLNLEVFEKVKAVTEVYGIEVQDVKIKRFDLPTTNESAVYERMIAERNQITQRYIAEGESEAAIIRNNVDKQVNIIKSDASAKAEATVAEGEAEYMRLLAEAYNTPEKQDFYTFMLSLDALKLSLTGVDKTVILGSDSDLVKVLLGSQN